MLTVALLLLLVTECHSRPPPKGRNFPGRFERKFPFSSSGVGVYSAAVYLTAAAPFANTFDVRTSGGSCRVDVCISRSLRGVYDGRLLHVIDGCDPAGSIEATERVRKLPLLFDFPQGAWYFNWAVGAVSPNATCALEGNITFNECLPAGNVATYGRKCKLIPTSVPFPIKPNKDPTWLRYPVNHFLGRVSVIANLTCSQGGGPPWQWSLLWGVGELNPIVVEGHWWPLPSRTSVDWGSQTVLFVKPPFAQARASFAASNELPPLLVGVDGYFDYKYCGVDAVSIVQEACQPGFGGPECNTKYHLLSGRGPFIVNIRVPDNSCGVKDNLCYYAVHWRPGKLLRLTFASTNGNMTTFPPFVMKALTLPASNYGNHDVAISTHARQTSFVIETGPSAFPVPQTLFFTWAVVRDSIFVKQYLLTIDEL